MTIKKETALTPKTILLHNDATAVGVVVDDAYYVTDTAGRKIVPKGTPLTGDLTARATAFVKAADTQADVKGIYTLQITTAFIADEVLTIEGVDYTAKAVESVANKEFAVGADASAQVTSLLKMVTCADFDVTGATDTLTFTQKAANEANVPVVSKTSATGVIGPVKTVAAPVVAANNAVGVLQHDTDVTDGNNNGSLIVRGDVDLNKLDTDTANLVTAACKRAVAGRILFMK
jgi:hypothetical protein